MPFPIHCGEFELDSVVLEFAALYSWTTCPIGSDPVGPGITFIKAMSDTLEMLIGSLEPCHVRRIRIS